MADTTNTTDTIATEVSTFSGMQDQRGNVSSKRVWAYRFGWATIIQLSLGSVLIGLATLLMKVDIPPLLADLYKFGITSTLAGCLIALGFTLPEWAFTKK